jgi:hypothetical protein
LTEQRNSLRAKWRSEKEIVDQIQAKKNEIEQSKLEEENPIEATLEELLRFDTAKFPSN